MFRNIRLASFDEFVTLGFHVFVLLVELGVFVNCGPPGRGLGWVAFVLWFLSAVPGIDLFCNSLTGSPGLGCWGWHRGNYRELLVMFLCRGFQRQSQGSICGSLHYHSFVILVVLGVFANRVLKAGRKTRKRFGVFFLFCETFGKHRLTSL